MATDLRPGTEFSPPSLFRGQSNSCRPGNRASLDLGLVAAGSGASRLRPVMVDPAGSYAKAPVACLFFSVS